MSGHKFKIGQLVRYLGRDGAHGAYQVTRRQGMIGAANAHYDGIKALSETDFTEDLLRLVTGAP
jgi:hypothetical protein